MEINPRFPVYVVSKGRWESRLTVRHLEGMRVPYRVIIEEHEYPQYRAVIDAAKILVLDPQFQRDYETLDDLGDSKSRGPGPARNFAWAHSLTLGHQWHWVLDDNLRGFYRAHRNEKIRCVDGAPLRSMEDFTLRYTNIGMAGPQYDKFSPRKLARSEPYVTNTRIYSCNLIRNSLPFRWRGRYNEDTDLSLRILKAGWVTIEFYAFLQGKTTTQTVKGGCNKDFYEREGTLPKSQMLARMHPDVARVEWKFHRWHHFVDYSRFKQKLIRDPSVTVPDRDPYGMTIVPIPRPIWQLADEPAQTI